MCGGGDDSGGDDDQTPAEKVASGKGRNLDADMAAGSKYSAGYESGNPNVDNFSTNEGYTNAVLGAKGYTDDYKGVKSGSGGSVTDSKGNAVKSGTYDRAENEAQATFDSYQEYKTERAKAQGDFYDDMEARQQVDQSLIDMAMGGGGYAKGFYNADGTINENFDPSTSFGMQGPARPGQFNDLGSYLGSSADQFSFPGYSFADPLGTAMDGRLSRIDGSALGSEITTRNEQNYFDNFSSGYNDDAGFFGRQLEADQAGNIGLSTAGQRFSDAAGGLVMGLVGGAFGPLGSALAGATKVNTMDAYGENVPGFNSQVQTTTIGGANLLGGLLGNALAPGVAGAVGKGVYGATGNINAAIGGQMAAGAATPYATGAAANALIGDKFDYMSSDIGGPMDRDIAERMEARGFGDSIGGNDGGGNSRPAGQMSSQLAPTDGQGGGINTGQNVTDANIQSVSGSDVGMGDLMGTGAQTEFDPQAFLMAQAQNMNPNTTQVTDFFGNSANTMDVNPLFSAQAPGVQYLSKGRQRNFGSGIFNVQNAFEQKKSRRRGSLGDKLVGIVV